jgi:hypothetical protein
MTELMNVWRLSEVLVTFAFMLVNLFLENERVREVEQKNYVLLDQ